MNIPLDRLYHYIENLAETLWHGNVLIYHFYPHGSKNIKDLAFLQPSYPPKDMLLLPYVFCNDQEPLDYARYQTDTHLSKEQIEIVQAQQLEKMNLRDWPIDIWDWAILLHSEQRSTNVEQYQRDGFLPVYYWSHAIIARDWFRYAEHVTVKPTSKKTFLIYNRAWAGTREYRLEFLNILLRLGLENHCQTSVSPIEPELGIHYDLHKFINPQWRPTAVLEDYFPVSNAHSHYSADFDQSDYDATDIEVVLETLFDDDRLHLTEKILRPIALGQPFILAGTIGSLEYIKKYGFKTFGHIWDERYDQESNHHYRLIAIGDLMRKIANWDPETRKSKLAQAREIAEYNKRRFFSQEFFDQVINELKQNLSTAFTYLEENNTSKRWSDWYKRISEENQQKPELFSQITPDEWNEILAKIAY